VIAWQECQDDPQSEGTRSRGTLTVWRYPHDLFPLYKSATLHTVKRKLPLRVVGLPLLVVALGVLAWWGFSKLGGIKETGTKAPQGVAAAHGGFASGSGTKEPPANAAEYLERATPRVSGMPWSAPLFDDRKPKAEPDIYCVAVEHQSCRCYTEQVTPVGVAQNVCMEIARHGVYNPYRDPARFANNNANQPSADNSSSRGATFGAPSDSRAGSPAGSLDGRDLKVSGDALGGKAATSWPRPDFSYTVPFPGVGGRR